MPATPPGYSTSPNLVASLRSISHTFLTLQATASDSCTIESGASACWEPSTIYFWTDLIDALEKMVDRGVAGRTFYSGPSGTDSLRYGLANLAAFLAQTMQETIQYDACDENNWSNSAAVDMVIAAGGSGGKIYPATAACGQLGQSYQNYHCSETIDPETGQPIAPSDLECAVDPEMVQVARTSAGWYGAPPPLFCAPRSILSEAPRWDVGGWCPTMGASWDQPQHFAPPFDTVARGELHYGPSTSTANVPPEILASSPGYLDYVKGAVDQGTGEACLMGGTCCMDKANQRAGSWESCAGGCENGARPDLVVGSEPRTDVEGCCWWGRGAIQTTGTCNFGKLNYFAGKKAADRGKDALFPEVDFCRDPGAICDPQHPELKWFSGLFYWLNDVQPYDVRGVSYLTTLRAWVDNGARLTDHSLVDMASGIVNRGCHDAPFEGEGGTDPCGNGEIHAGESRRKNFEYIWRVLEVAATGADTAHLPSASAAAVSATSAPSSGQQAPRLRSTAQPQEAKSPSAGDHTPVALGLAIVIPCLVIILLVGCFYLGWFTRAHCHTVIPPPPHSTTRVGGVKPCGKHRGGEVGDGGMLDGVIINLERSSMPPPPL